MGQKKNPLFHLYRALVQSKLDYGCTIYGSARDSYLETLNRIHHQGLQICLGAFCTSPVHSLYAEAGESSLANRWLRLCLNYYTKLYSEINNPTYEWVFDGRFIEEYIKNPNCIPQFGIRICPQAEKAEINLSVINNFSKVPDTPLLTLNTPEIRFDLASYRKENTSSLVYKGMFGELCLKYPAHEKIFPNGLKSENGVAASTVHLTKKWYRVSQTHTIRHISVHSWNHCPISGIRNDQNLQEKNFIIFSDSLSALEAISDWYLNNLFFTPLAAIC